MKFVVVSIKKLEYEDFDEAYYSVYGKKWDPYKYGESSEAELNVSD